MAEEQRDNNTGGCTGSGWRPGQSGNPNGRPRTRPMTDEICKQLAAAGGKELEAIIAKAITEAKAGDVRYFKELMDRMDGKVREMLDLTSNDQALSAFAGLNAAQLAKLAEMVGGPE